MNFIECFEEVPETYKYDLHMFFKYKLNNEQSTELDKLLTETLLNYNDKTYDLEDKIDDLKEEIDNLKEEKFLYKEKVKSLEIKIDKCL